jgi:microcin C transport system substrate-binding protein
MQNCRMRNLLILLTALIVCLIGQPGWAAHGYSLWGDFRYPPDFPHFSYVNSDAPKGGELRLVSNQRTSTFDKYNPFTIKGSAPAYLASLMFDSLLAGALDETSAGYGLLAQDVTVGADGLSATFQLRPQARFHNGSPVLALDVKYSFDTLVGPFASPGYRSLLEDVVGADGCNDRAFSLQAAQPRIAAHGGRIAHLQSPMGDGKR